ncbi:acetoin utilization protein AcuC [Pseudactinotalea sp. Z1732]|uniref:acetoin utilization protein AcuC n=1 Tax=Micrococcales TaxID=85006 RepID=UPI003C7B8BCA
MTARVQLPWSPELLTYNFGPGHPMAPVRTRLAFALLEHLGLLQSPQVHLIEATAADDAMLGTVHEPGYIQAVRRGGRGTPDEQRGLGTMDNPLFEAMHDSSALIAGASVAAARAVWTGQVPHAVNIAGGLHHAMAGRAGGFCIYNDVAIAIRWLLDHGAERVLYVDVDAHHGDGVEAAFWDEPRVVTVSVHQNGETIFPGTGFAQDIGGPNAQGHAVNVALPPGVDDKPWLRAVEAVLVPVAKEFGPQVIVSQHGADAHRHDPLTQMDVSVDAQVAAAQMIAQVAAEHAQDRWVATGGGGYDVAATVPRVWARLVAAAAGVDIRADTPTPQAWRDLVADLGLGPAPETMGEGMDTGIRSWVDGYDPADSVDRAIMATRRSAFPALGLDPLTAW